MTLPRHPLGSRDDSESITKALVAAPNLGDHVLGPDDKLPAHAQRSIETLLQGLQPLAAKGVLAQAPQSFQVLSRFVLDQAFLQLLEIDPDGKGLAVTRMSTSEDEDQETMLGHVQRLLESLNRQEESPRFLLVAYQSTGGSEFNLNPVYSIIEYLVELGLVPWVAFNATDRVSRNVKAGLHLLDRLNHMGVDLRAMDVNGGSPIAAFTDRFIFTQLLVMAEWQLHELRGHSTKRRQDLTLPPSVDRSADETLTSNESWPVQVELCELFFEATRRYAKRNENLTIPEFRRNVLPKNKRLASALSASSDTGLRNTLTDLTFVTASIDHQGEPLPIELQPEHRPLSRAIYEANREQLAESNGRPRSQGNRWDRLLASASTKLVHHECQKEMKRKNVHGKHWYRCPGCKQSFDPCEVDSKAILALHEFCALDQSEHIRAILDARHGDAARGIPTSVEEAEAALKHLRAQLFDAKNFELPARVTQGQKFRDVVEELVLPLHEQIEQVEHILKLLTRPSLEAQTAAQLRQRIRDILPPKLPEDSLAAQERARAFHAAISQVTLIGDPDNYELELEGPRVPTTSPPFGPVLPFDVLRRRLSLSDDKALQSPGADASEASDTQAQPDGSNAQQAMGSCGLDTSGSPGRAARHTRYSAVGDGDASVAGWVWRNRSTAATPPEESG